MLTYTIAHILLDKPFKRRFGVNRQTFVSMVDSLTPQWRPMPTPGAKPKLNLEERVLVTLEYWREYRTYFHIASSWGVSESTICRCVHWGEDALISAPQFHLPGKKQLLQEPLNVVLMDVTETPIERPKRRQRRFYSGKKKRHTLKCQLIIDADTGSIVCTFLGRGRQHDFKVFQASGVHFHPDTKSLVDKGYQGIQKLHSNSAIPQKKPRGGTLSSDAKAANRALARERIGIEYVNGRLKVFRILAERYRNRRHRFGLRCNLMAAIYNREYAKAA
ncbi:MAG: IS5 family transposase [Leptolyngbyaceae cyanobacterium]